MHGSLAVCDVLHPAVMVEIRAFLTEAQLNGGANGWRRDSPDGPTSQTLRYIYLSV
jgi:hypothetical protein